MNVKKAIKLNKMYGNRSHLGWFEYYAQISRMLGFQNQTPNYWMFAVRLATWQKAQVPGLKGDGIIGPKTWKRIQKDLNITNSASSSNNRKRPIQIKGTAQTFANAKPGNIPIDQGLIDRNKEIGKFLIQAADNYKSKEDFRWFFSRAHALITRKIINHIRRFQRPNALLELNIHFAEAYIRAISSQNPAAPWKDAFKFCKALQKNSEKNPLLWTEIEMCGAKMANVHIKIDIANSLKEVGCIPPQDFGNMLVFINEASKATLQELRWDWVAAIEEQIMKLVAPWVDLEVETWRNTVYKRECSANIPEPNPNFIGR